MNLLIKNVGNGIKIMTFLIEIRVDRLTQINQSNKTHLKISPKNLIRKSNMMGFQIQDDKKLVLEKNLIRKSKMFILGIDDLDHGLGQDWTENKTK